MTSKRSATRHPKAGRRPDPIRPGGPPRANPIPLTRRFTRAALPRHPIDRSTAGAGLAESPGTLRPALHSRLAEPRRRASAPRQRSRRLDAERPSEVPTDGDPRAPCRRASQAHGAGARQRISPVLGAVLGGGNWGFGAYSRTPLDSGVGNLNWAQAPGTRASLPNRSGFQDDNEGWRCSGESAACRGNDCDDVVARRAVAVFRAPDQAERRAVVWILRR